MKIIKKGAKNVSTNEGPYVTECPSCSATLIYKKCDVQEEWDLKKQKYTGNYYIECPCCKDTIKVPEGRFIDNLSFSKRKNSTGRNPIKVLTRGTFSMQTKCPVCGSLLEYDYSDSKECFVMDDAYCSRIERYITCPKCHYDIKIKK